MLVVAPVGKSKGSPQGHAEATVAGFSKVAADVHKGLVDPQRRSADAGERVVVGAGQRAAGSDGPNFETPAVPVELNVEARQRALWRRAEHEGRQLGGEVDGDLAGSLELSEKAAQRIPLKSTKFR